MHISITGTHAVLGELRLVIRLASGTAL